MRTWATQILSHSASCMFCQRYKELSVCLMKFNRVVSLSELRIKFLSCSKWHLHPFIGEIRCLVLIVQALLSLGVDAVVCQIWNILFWYINILFWCIMVNFNFLNYFVIVIYLIYPILIKMYSFMTYWRSLVIQNYDQVVLGARLGFRSQQKHIWVSKVWSFVDGIPRNHEQRH